MKRKITPKSKEKLRENEKKNCAKMKKTFFGRK